MSNIAGVTPPCNPDSQVNEEEESNSGGFTPSFHVLNDKNIPLIVPKIGKGGGQYLLRLLPRPTPPEEAFPYYSPINPNWYQKLRAAEASGDTKPSVAELLWWKEGALYPTAMVSDANGHYYLNASKFRDDGTVDDHWKDPYATFHYSAKWVLACEVFRQRNHAAASSQLPNNLKKIVKRAVESQYAPSHDIAVADNALGRLPRVKGKNGEYYDAKRGGKPTLFVQALCYETPEDGPLATPFYCVVALQTTAKDSFLSKVSRPHNISEPHSLANNGLGDFMSLEQGCVLRLHKVVEEGKTPKYEIEPHSVMPLQEAHLTAYWKEWKDLLHFPTVEGQIQILMEAFGEPLVGYCLAGKDGTGHYADLLPQSALEASSQIPFESYNDVKAAPTSTGQAPPPSAVANQQMPQAYAAPAPAPVPVAQTAPPVPQPPTPAPAPVAQAAPPVPQPPAPTQAVQSPPVPAPAPAPEVAPTLPPPVTTAHTAAPVPPTATTPASTTTSPSNFPPVPAPTPAPEVAPTLPPPVPSPEPVPSAAPQTTTSIPTPGSAPSVPVPSDDPLSSIPGMDMQEAIKRRRNK